MKMIFSEIKACMNKITLFISKYCRSYELAIGYIIDAKFYGRKYEWVVVSKVGSGSGSLKV